MILERARTPRLPAGVARERDTERPSATRDKKVVAKESRRVQGKATATLPATWSFPGATEVSRRTRTTRTATRSWSSKE